MGIIDRKLKVFYRKTKKGNIIKIVREHYIRDDVWCGLHTCSECTNVKKTLQHLSESTCNFLCNPHHVIIDTNVALHQIDLLSHDHISNVIIFQTVLQEVKHRSLAVYKRLRDLIATAQKHFFVFTNEHHSDCYTERQADESANDRNDRAIRMAALWYKNHFSLFSQNIVLLTNDIANRNKARDLQIESYTIPEYVSGLQDCPELIDLVAQIPDSENSEGGTSFQKIIYPPHWSLEKLRSSLKAGKIRQGILKTSRSNYLEANVMVEGMERSVLVQGRENLNRALHDDLVAIEMLPESEWSSPSTVVIEQEEQVDKEEDKENEAASVESEKNMLSLGMGGGEVRPSARVVGIIRHKWRQYCGIIRRSELHESVRHLFIPADKRIPFIRVETRQADSLLNKRIIVAIDSWPRDSRNPKGHFVRTIGDVGEKETENEVVLLEHDCPHTKFSESVLNCLPKLPWLITEKDESEREDLRHLDICSVDPVGCTDIDDALHCREMDNGNYEVGVHIADVSHFIRPGTALDKEAQNRSTTVYLTNRRIDMVPDLLSSNLCSLRGNVDRFAFSVIWEMMPSGDVLSSKFCKSIIRSRGELTYEQAQQRIDDTNMQDSLTKSLRNLNKLAKKLKKQRLKDGALVLASMEVKFHFDPDTDSVVDIVAKQHLETMSMVEEFMLLANVTSAKTTYLNFKDCAMLRRHPAPPQSNFDPLLIAAKSQNVHLDVSSNKALSQSLSKATKKDNPFFNSMLRIMTTRCMMQALYFCSGTQEEPEFYHYGLACPFYTHFTSPIRRYADIVVHRLLAVIIGADHTYPDLLDQKKCADLAHHINYRHKMAQYAGRASAVITAIESLKGKVKEYDAYIISIKKNAIDVLAPAIGQQLTIYLPGDRKADIKRREASSKEMEPDPQVDFEFLEKDLCLKCGSVEFRPFDELRVQLSVDDSDVQHQRIMTKLVHPVIPGFSVQPLKRELECDGTGECGSKAKKIK